MEDTTYTDETAELGLFGDMDIDEVPDDPFFVAAGTYLCSCTDAKIMESKKNPGQQGLYIQYTIDEPRSDFHGMTLSDWFQLFLGQDYKSLDANEKRTVTNMKVRLRDAFDVPESKLKQTKPSELMGREMYVTVTNTPGKGEHAGKTFINITKAISRRRWEEENEGRADDSVSAAGL
jgi:hypothetical protein